MVQVWARHAEPRALNVQMLFNSNYDMRGKKKSDLRQGKPQRLHPPPPYYPFPRGKFHTRGNMWGFTVG